MAIAALYPGSFDPLTNGHIDIIARAARLVGRLVVAIGAHHEKTAFLPAGERKSLIAAQMSKIGGNIEVELFSGLLVDAARDFGANILVRGLRNGADFDYEMQMAGMNGALAPDIETIFLAASPGINYISSSLVRQISTMGGDITPFVPAAIAAAVSRAVENRK